MSAAITGVNATVDIGTTSVDASGVNLDIEIDTFDTSTTADLGYADATGGLKKVSGSFDFFYNIAKKPTGTAAGGLGLIPGSIIATMTISVDSINNATEIFTGKALITKLSLKSKVQDGWMITCSFMGKGPWTLPA